MKIDYFESALPVRRDLWQAHQQVWDAMAKPGTWCSGDDRIAIAQATRDALACDLCRKRKSALSPYTDQGQHDSTVDLPDSLIDVVHRVTTDTGRLTRRWFESIAETGLDEAHYVEAIAVAIRTISVDTFCRAIGFPRHPLPVAVAGAPSKRRPVEARLEGAWVATIPNGAAAPSEKDLYGEHHAENVLRALSLVPDEQRMSIHVLVPPQYIPAWRVPDPTFDPGRAISRLQMEYVAARVSALNDCFY